MMTTEQPPFSIVIHKLCADFMNHVCSTMTILQEQLARADIERSELKRNETMATLQICALEREL